jgi:uncharacterized protein (TIGR03086 family)
VTSAAQSEPLDLRPTAAEVARLVAGVRDDQLDGPTPCAGVPVGGLLDHVLGLAEGFRLAAGKQPVTEGPRWSAEELPADWRSRLPRRLTELADAWGTPGAWTGTTAVVGLTLPAGVMGLAATDEVLLHGWDLAAATGQRFDPDPAAVERCLAFVTGLAAGAREMRDGMFGPEVPVPADAPALDRLLGLAGRDPGWRPG